MMPVRRTTEDATERQKAIVADCRSVANPANGPAIGDDSDKTLRVVASSLAPMPDLSPISYCPALKSGRGSAVGSSGAMAVRGARSPDVSFPEKILKLKTGFFPNFGKSRESR